MTVVPYYPALIDIYKKPRGFSKASIHQTYVLVPERQQDTIADQEAQPPEDSQPQADIVKVVVAASQQIPGLQLFSRKPLGHLVVHDALHPSPGEVEYVGHLKLRGRVQVFVAAAPPDLLDLLLQGGGLPSDYSWNGTGTPGVNTSLWDKRG